MMMQAHSVKSRATAQPSSSAARAGLLQRKCACGGSAGFSGQCEECGKNRLGVQRRAAGPATGIAPPIVHDVLRSPGQPLDPATRAFMEPRFGYDFSRVRVHADARAARSADAVDALAYTVGRDIVFAAGRYAPRSNQGRKLLAHELTHVRQQADLAAGAGWPLSLAASTDPLERDAEHTEAQIIENIPSHKPSSSASVHFATAALQRAPAAKPVSPDPAERVLSQEEIAEAIKFNGKMLKDPSLLAIVRDVIGIPKISSVSDQDMALAVARYQTANGLAQDGKVNEVTVTFIIEELQAKGDDASAEALKGPYQKRVQATGASKRKVLLDVDESYCQCGDQLKTGIERSKFLITEYQTCGKDSKSKTGTDVENCVLARSKERGEKPRLLGETDLFGTITIFPQSGACGSLIDRITLAHEQTHAMHNRELLRIYGDPTTLRGMFGGAKKFNRAYSDPARWVESEVRSRETEIAVARWAISILDRICPTETKGPGEKTR
jgi:hypothetical protein